MTVRIALAAVLLAGLLLIGGAIFRPVVDVVELAAGGLLVVGAGLLAAALWPQLDVLGDHPDERER